MIIGIGVDVVEIARFQRALDRSPRLAERLFLPAERAGRDAASLAARFAAKEALVKALGGPGGLRWHDAEVGADERGRPVLALTGTVAAAARRLAVDSWHLSLSHDAGVAIAVVVAQAAPGGAR